MADLEGDEVFDKATLGECASVCEERVGDGELLYFRGCKNGQVRVVLLLFQYPFLYVCSIYM